MAKGNIGNLLQHFVALSVAHRIVADWSRPDIPIEYIDCYSMAPWEPVTGKQPQGFVERIRSFPQKRDNEDLVASAFLRAWETRYLPGEVPKHPNDRDYPNTAVLLRNAFPEQCWRMRLHENDLAGNGKRAGLEDWARNQDHGEYLVEGDWQKSQLIGRSPAPTDRPVLVMLDPFRIVSDDVNDAEITGKLPPRLLRFLCGGLGLKADVAGKRTAPIVFTLFSFSDAKPSVPDRVVRDQFGSGWTIERVQSGRLQGQAGATYHQGWVASKEMTTPVLGRNLQFAWDQWNQ